MRWLATAVEYRCNRDGPAADRPGMTTENEKIFIFVGTLFWLEAGSGDDGNRKWVFGFRRAEMERDGVCDSGCFSGSMGQLGLTNTNVTRSICGSNSSTVILRHSVHIQTV